MHGQEPPLRKPNVFSVPPGVPFLTTFARALVAGQIVSGFPKADDPLGFSDATIYVPTRRAARALATELATAFGDRFGFDTALLPRIIPLGHMEGLETNLIFSTSEAEDRFDTDVPLAVPPLQRRLVLSNLVLAWARQLRVAALREALPGDRDTPSEALLVATSAAQAWHLSGDLAGLIDEMIIEDVSWDAVERLNAETFDEYWSLTTKFLQIAAKFWPSHLAEQGLMEAAARQALLATQEAERLASGADARPVIAIGSTGTNRATAHLLAAIASAPQGAVVLPGLDLDLDEATWQLIGRLDAAKLQQAASHPQAALFRLLPVLKIERRDVQELGRTTPQVRARTRFLSEAFIPADATERWVTYAQNPTALATMAEALGDITLIEAADEREEALALAVQLRAVLETPGATAALITPDRTLAKRVRSELLRWQIEIDDSGGESLGSLPAGRLAHLVLAASEGVHKPHDLLALLEHPMVRLGFARDRLVTLKHQLDVAVLRTIILPGSDIAAVMAQARAAASKRHAHPTRQRLTEADWQDLTGLLTRLDDALSLWRAFASQGAQLPLETWVRAHRQAMAALLWDHVEPLDLDNPLWPETEDAQALAQIFEELTQSARVGPAFTGADYQYFLISLLRETSVRMGGRTHPRLKILGLLEARLLQEDVVLLGGLDETIWPPQTGTDAFLNRPMRASLGLTPPERRIGQTAHDFVQAMGEGKVIISRAAKRGGAPTVPSRFLQRMAALAGPLAWDACRQRGEACLQQARSLDMPQGTTAGLQRPAPKPAVALRPTALSVTRIEALRRDPYAIYAEFILRLVPLEDLGVSLGAREYGTALHDVLEGFVKAVPVGPWPANAASILRALAEQHLAPFLCDPLWLLFEWPQVERFLQATLRFEQERRTTLRALHIEQRGVLNLTMEDGSNFALSGTADRIETHENGGVVLIDFKRKRVPTHAEINAGFAPQLPLEAWMLQHGAFEQIRAPQLTDVIHIPLLGQEDLVGTSIVSKTKTLDSLIAEHETGLMVLLNQCREPDFAYVPRPYPQFVRAFNPYDHLSRVKEWSAGGGGDEA